MYKILIYKNLFLVLSKNYFILAKIFIMKLLLFVSFLLISISSLGQTISGKITAKNGDEIPYANVYLKKTKVGTATNEEGFYQLKNISNGNYILVISSIGYQTKSIKIVVENNQKLIKNFKLKYPKHPQIVNNYFLLAQVMYEDRSQRKLVRGILQGLIKKHPEHELTSEIKDWLQSNKVASAKNLEQQASNYLLTSKNK